ncbi:MAG: FixH family protein [Thioalkalispiraceae bacterium]|jgi:hypothetical protein
MTMTETREMIKPWYRQFWPWFLMSFPAAAVIAGIITIVIATSNKDHAVVDDYYKKGLAINRVIDQQQQAASMGLTASAEYVEATGELELVLDSKSNVNLDSLGLKMVHPTRASLDRHVLLHKDDKGLYKTKLNELQAGRWNAILEPADQQWRLDARIVIPAGKWRFKPNV